jgi:hypothetical protein
METNTTACHAATDPEPLWIQPMDVLVDLCVCLLEQAHFLQPYDALGRYAWFEEAAFLLTHVPSQRQRLIWAEKLATSINLCGLPITLVAHELLRPRETTA